MSLVQDEKVLCYWLQYINIHICFGFFFVNVRGRSLRSFCLDLEDYVTFAFHVAVKGDEFPSNLENWLSFVVYISFDFRLQELSGLELSQP